MVALTGRNEAYYTDYLGTPQEFISAVKCGYLYQGQRYAWQKQAARHAGARPAAGALRHLPPEPRPGRQLGRGLRAAMQLTSPGRYRAMTALLLLAPGTPMLFQGQEFAASSPFLYFADHKPELAAAGRARAATSSWRSFRSLAGPSMQALLADPARPAHLRALQARLRRTRRRHAEAYALHRDLLQLRREDPRLPAPAPARRGRRGARRRTRSCCASSATDGDDRLLLVNLGRDLHLDRRPRAAAGAAGRNALAGALVERGSALRRRRHCRRWTREDNWRIPGDAAVVLCAGPTEERP